MEAKIDAKGFLWAKRAGKFESQSCPWATDSQDWSYCGDHCPFFTEKIELDYTDVRLNCVSHSSTNFSCLDERKFTL